MDINKDSTDALQTAAHLITLAAAAATPTHVGGIGYHHAVVPAGYSLVDITAKVEAAQALPQRQRGTVTLHDMASLLKVCAHQAAGWSLHGALYADQAKGHITAVFNDQRMQAGWRDFRAQFVAEFTPEWQRWNSRNKQKFTQLEFAEFIEDNLQDLHGDAVKLLEVASTLQASTSIAFKSARRLDNGQNQLTYVETIDATAGAAGELTIPREFLLGIQVFKHGARYEQRARLKYRMSGGGQVSFHYELDRPERTVEAAFAGYVEAAEKDSGFPVLRGPAP